MLARRIDPIAPIAGAVGATERETGFAVMSELAHASDADLMMRIAKGDAAGFRALVDRHLHTVLAIARRTLRDDAEAEDVAQEAMLRLWRTGGRLELGAGGVVPWLRRVTANLCIDRMRSGHRLIVTDETPDAGEPPRQQQGLEQRDLKGRVDQALKQLPERQRLALTLFHHEGLSQAEVAEMLGVSDEAVESLLSRARRALRAMLQDEWRQLLPDG